VDFIAALRLPAGVAVALYAGELPAVLTLPANVAELDTCVIGITYRGAPVILFSCPRDALQGLERTIQPIVDEAVRSYVAHGDTAVTSGGVSRVEPLAAAKQTHSPATPKPTLDK